MFGLFKVSFYMVMHGENRVQINSFLDLSHL